MANVAEEDFAIEREIFVLREKVPNEDGWCYTKVPALHQDAVNAVPILKAVLDEESKLYQVISEANLYLLPVSDCAFQPMEKSTPKNKTDLLRISPQYHLTQTQVADIDSIINENPNVQIVVYAPNINDTTGTINEKKCRVVQVTARDNLTEYYLGKGSHTIFSIINTVGNKMTVGLAMTNGLLNFFGIDFHSDSSSIAQKSEVANFQYLDFFELNTTYITRGTSSFGSITIRTTTTNWVKKSNGDFVNQPSIKQVSGHFYALFL